MTSYLNVYFTDVVSQKVLPIFMQGSYSLAVFEAFKRVEVAVREAGGYEENDRGTDLMRKAFHVDNGNLTDQNQHPAEKQARSESVCRSDRIL